MSDLDDFLTPTLARQIEAEQALINGDPGPRLAMWSAQEPVTVFGAEKTVIGSEEAREVFHWPLPDLTHYRFELPAAGLGLHRWLRHLTVSMDGGPSPDHLGVTHLPPRTEWKTIHRHAAPQPVRSGPPTHRRSKRPGRTQDLAHRTTVP